MTTLFVTGTGTELGKTYVSALLIAQARAAGRRVLALKPVVSGIEPGEEASSDPGRLLTAMGEPVTRAALDRIAPWRLRAALSPDMAAAREGVALRFEDVVSFCARTIAAQAPDLALIEGAGGLMSPLTPGHLNIELAEALHCPVLLVAGTYLGTISHTLSAATVLAGRGVTCRGIVLSESPESPVPPAQTAAAIAAYLPDMAIRVVPRDAGAAGAPDLFALIH